MVHEGSSKKSGSVNQGGIHMKGCQCQQPWVARTEENVQQCLRGKTVVGGEKNG